MEGKLLPLNRTIGSDELMGLANGKTKRLVGFVKGISEGRYPRQGG